jgi:uncharacterized protein (DUF1800 family)
MRGNNFLISQAATLLALAWAHPSLGQASDPGPSEEQQTVHLLNRATFGVRPADVERVRAMGVEAWLEEQLRPEQVDDPIEEDVLQRYASVGMELDELFATYPPPQQLQALRVRLQDSTSLDDEERRRLRRELAEKAPGRVLGEMTAAKLTRAAFSKRQLEQVMTDFWFDHFNVFWGKGADRWLVADYERSAIRPHVFGSFEDMLVATASHGGCSSSVSAARICEIWRGVSLSELEASG